MRPANYKKLSYVWLPDQIKTRQIFFSFNGVHPVFSVAEDNRPLKEKLYDTLPRSMKAEVLVRVRDEDPEVQIERQELTRAKSPMELSQISSPADFPIPKNIENLMNKNKRGKAKLFYVVLQFWFACIYFQAENGPTPPPRRFRKEESSKKSLPTT